MKNRQLISRGAEEPLVRGAVSILSRKLVHGLQPLIGIEYTSELDGSVSFTPAYDLEFPVCNSPEESWDPDSLDTTSVRMTVRELVIRALGEKNMQNVGKKAIEKEARRLSLVVMNQINTLVFQEGPREPETDQMFVYLRCRSIEIENERSKIIEIRLQDLLWQLFDGEEMSPGDKEGVCAEIDTLIRRYTQLGKEIDTIRALWSADGLFSDAEEGGPDEENSHPPTLPGDSFYLRDDFSAPNSTLGGLDFVPDDEDDLAMETDIPYSSTEQFFLRFLPNHLIDSEMIDTTYMWGAPEREEWQREIVAIEDYPREHKNMIEFLILRKKLIFFYGNMHLISQEGQANTSQQIDDTFEDNLAKLSREIIELEGIVKTIQVDDKDNTGSHSDIETEFSYEDRIRVIDGKLRELGECLKKYYEQTDGRAAQKKTILGLYVSICESIRELGRLFPEGDLTEYCEASLSPEENPFGSDPIAAEKLYALDGSTIAPGKIDHGPAEYEYILRDMFAEVGKAFQPYPRFFARGPVSDDMPLTRTGKLEALADEISGMAHEKAWLYFQVHCYLEDNPDPDIDLALELFGHEIFEWLFLAERVSTQLLLMEDTKKGSEQLILQSEKWILGRLQLLRQFFHAPPGDTIRSDLITKIALATGNIERSGKMGDDIRMMYDVPSQQRKAEPLSDTELVLLTAIDEPCLGSKHDLYADTWSCLLSSSGDPNTQNTVDREEFCMRHLSRLYLLYFYAKKEEDRLLSLLQTGESFLDNEGYATRLTLIQGELPVLHRLIVDTEAKYTRGSEEKPKKQMKISPHLGKLNTVISRLDGLTAHFPANTPIVLELHAELSQILNSAVKSLFGAEKNRLRKQIMRNTHAHLRAIVEKYNKGISSKISKNHAYFSDVLRYLRDTERTINMLSTEPILDTGNGGQRRGLNLRG